MFHPCPSLEHNDHCVLCVETYTLTHPHTSTPSLPLLFSAATDGCVAVWSLAPQLEKWGVAAGEGQRSIQLLLQPVLVFKVHQSGVNTMAISYQGKYQSVDPYSGMLSPPQRVGCVW